MVLISGNKRSLLHLNDVRSKAPGVTAHHSPQHQQGGKNFETRTSHNNSNSSNSSNLTKGMTATLDEFKYGFPSEGLSTTSNKWWGSSDDSPDDSTGKKAVDGADASKHREDQLEEKETKKEADTEMSEAGKEEAMKTLEGASLLRDIRKRTVEEGREALKLGVSRGYGVKKLGKREKIMLLQIFSSTLPSSWMHDS